MPTEPLSKKQQRFAWLIGKLIIYANAAGYQLTFSEAYRTKAQAAIYAKKGIGIADSVHCDRLAVDFNVFRDGKLLTDYNDIAPLGEWWKMQDKDARWGGDFKTHDGPHFSFYHNGRA